MLELHAINFMGASTQLARMSSIVSGRGGNPEAALLDTSIAAVKPMLESFGVEASTIGAKLSWLAADRLYRRLNAVPCDINWGDLGLALADIESRFADHLNFVKLFVIPEDQAVLFAGADQLLKPETAALFPSVWFDCEEAAKCLGLNRATASVFHSMRMIEIAISAISKRLSIPDPAKADRSWGNMLKAIKAKLDELHPAKDRAIGSEGAQLEAVYVSLDAIKNPWRNATMHVETVYTEEEARHILVCASHLFDKMASIFDEDGIGTPLAAPEFPLLEDFERA